MGGHPIRAAALTCAVVVTLLVGGCSAATPPATPAAAPAVASRPAPRAAATTTVSLTFDDGTRSQYVVRPILLDRGMRATFYVNSGMVDRADGSTMTWEQLRGLAADGNEIGGHTLTHAELPRVSDSEKRRQICQDRRRLIDQGFRPVSFAYPFGALDTASEAAVRACGYHSARSAGDVSPSGPGYAERIPPRDPYATAAFGGPPTALDLAVLQAPVLAAAAHGGGWVQIVLHNVCRPSQPDFDRCMRSETPVDIGVFTDFVDWLATGAPPGTRVRPVDAVTARG